MVEAHVAGTRCMPHRIIRTRFMQTFWVPADSLPTTKQHSAVQRKEHDSQSQAVRLDSAQLQAQSSAMSQSQTTPAHKDQSTYAHGQAGPQPCADDGPCAHHMGSTSMKSTPHEGLQAQLSGSATCAASGAAPGGCCCCQHLCKRPHRIRVRSNRVAPYE